MLDAGFLDGAQHLFGVGERIGQRLLADDVLAGLGSRDGLGSVHVARGRNVDHVDVLALDHLPPVSLNLLPTKLPGRCFHAGPVAPADHLQARRHLARKESAHLPVGIRVSFAHELVAEQANIDFTHASSPLPVPCRKSFVLGPLSLRLKTGTTARARRRHRTLTTLEEPRTHTRDQGQRTFF